MDSTDMHVTLDAGRPREDDVPAASDEGPAAAQAGAVSQVDEAPVLTDEERVAIHTRNAFIRAADAALTDVRQRSYEGKLTSSARWAKRSFAPEGIDAKVFEQQLLDYIEERDHAEAKPVLGRICAPQPLDVAYGERTFGVDEPLPELDVADIALVYGKKGVYLYSVALLSHSFARALFLAEEDNDVATFVDVVRSESSSYPRPVSINAFKNPPYLWPSTKTREVFQQVVESGSFADIAEVRASIGTRYYYSTLYLSAAQAASLAEWDAVERGRNP